MDIFDVARISDKMLGLLSNGWKCDTAVHQYSYNDCLLALVHVSSQNCECLCYVLELFYIIQIYSGITRGRIPSVGAFIHIGSRS